MEVISLFSYNIRFTVVPPLTATSDLQCTLATFFSSKPYIDSCLNFLTTPTSHFLLSPRWPAWRSSTIALFYSWFYDVFHYISKWVAYLVFSVNTQESLLLFPKLKYFQVIKERFILSYFTCTWWTLYFKFDWNSQVFQCSTCRSLQGKYTIPLTVKSGQAFPSLMN